MFLGAFTHTLDSKGRLTVPAKFRDQLATGLVVTRNPSSADRCLLVFPQSEWELRAAKISELSLIDSRSALLRRAFFSAAEDLKPDKQGRVLISQRLRDFANIESEVVVAGVNTFIELWQPGLWEEKVLGRLDDDELSGELFAAVDV
ncbi:MAG: division/cell wall cluster transcriptional repressor MraZ [Caldilineaceae bacterium]|nr:division/cell wall cluster transcriptional repressor MraZ [Caldilineaceae bacterium]